MVKSAFVSSVDTIQDELGSFFRDAGFRRKGRLYNRTTNDGLIQTVYFQLGPFDPPGTTYVPGLTKNLYGQFTVDIGVFVPEVPKLSGEEWGKWVHDASSHVRTRLGRTPEARTDHWWPAAVSQETTGDILRLLRTHASAFFSRFETREKLLREVDDAGRWDGYAMTPPWIIQAAILAEAHDRERAIAILERGRDRAMKDGMKGHAAYLLGLIRKL